MSILIGIINLLYGSRLKIDKIDLRKGGIKGGGDNLSDTIFPFFSSSKAFRTYGWSESEILWNRALYYCLT